MVSSTWSKYAVVYVVEEEEEEKLLFRCSVFVRTKSRCWGGFLMKRSMTLSERLIRGDVSVSGYVSRPSRVSWTKRRRKMKKKETEMKRRRKIINKRCQGRDSAIVQCPVQSSPSVRWKVEVQ